MTQNMLVQHEIISIGSVFPTDNLLFFGALLNKCAVKRKMIVCAFTLRANTQTTLCYMIPNIELGGFYLSKIAYQGILFIFNQFLTNPVFDKFKFHVGNIGDKSEALKRYGTQNSGTRKEVAVWKQAIKQLGMNYHPYMFKSYKLDCQVQIVERLALDKEAGLPPVNSMEQSCK